MKLSRMLTVVLAVVLLVGMMACSKNKQASAAVEGKVVNMPPWWNTQKDDAYVCTYGMGTNVKQSTSLDTAKNNALFEAAQYVEVQVKGMLKTYEEEAEYLIRNCWRSPRKWSKPSPTPLFRRDQWADGDQKGYRIRWASIHHLSPAQDPQE